MKDTKTKRTTIYVKIGDWEREYIPVDTDAPQEYDHGSTLEVLSSSEDRWVLIPKQRLDWQIKRYESGLHRYNMVERSHIKKLMQGKLVDRLFEE